MAWKRWVACYDLHGDQMEPRAVKAFLAFCDHWQPKERILGGDLVDLRPLRRKATMREMGESIRLDMTVSMQFLTDFRPTIWLRGNHDERLWWAAEYDQRGVISDLAQRGVDDFEAKCRAMKCRLFPYHKRDGIFQMGDRDRGMRFLHGYYIGKYAAARHADTYHRCIFGHIHAIQYHAIPYYAGPQAAICPGALCKLDMTYNEQTATSLRQAHGWSYGVVNTKTGVVLAWQAEEVDGTWLVATDVQKLTIG